MTEQINNNDIEKEKLQPLCKAFHWTTTANLEGIQKGERKVVFRKDGTHFITHEPGIWPQLLLGGWNWQTNLYEMRGPFIFTFMNASCPQEWKDYPDIFKSFFRNHIQGEKALISFDVKEADNPLIADLGSVITHFKDGQIQESFTGSKDYYRYFNSITPLKQYTGGFVLPELLIPGHIEAERLQVEQIA